ncbi:MAG TPA: M28 family metallopeptidase [Gemmatimonadota bacterium]|nr:M28 family metallopeptidase [Gemmatimonadota bacterium]
MKQRTRSKLSRTALPLVGALALAAACGPGADEASTRTGADAASAPPPPAATLAAISADSLRAAVAVLAHDSLEGRAPGTSGEQKTIRFLTRQFEALGLEPGNEGSWTQDVPLVSLTPDPDMALTITGEDGTETLAHKADFVATTEQVVERTSLDESELVFVGYGIVAPEYGWNDYDGIDAEGKTVVILVNDPGYATEDASLFNGRAMTYYGRWTYKYEEAARQGAAGALIVHRTGPAGYPWGVVENGWSGPQFGLAEPGDAPLLEAGGWITEDAARRLFERAGLEFDALDRAALTAEFAAVPLGLTASLAIENTIERSESPNFLAVLPGAERPDEYVIYTAHYDHFGVDPGLEGDSIYNGARDNATGTAGLIEIARAFRTAADAGQPPERSVMFLAVTAEEQGLLGSAYYATHPVVPLEQTAAVVNMDALNTWGATNDVTVVGLGNSELDDYARAAAEAQGRTIIPDPEPEKGYYFRSDHFEFAKQGVPALYTDPGIDMAEGGEDRGRAELAAYNEERYHQPSDELDAAWDLSGAVQDLEFFFRVGWMVANQAAWPNWSEDSEFRALRDAMMGRTRAESSAY